MGQFAFGADGAAVGEHDVLGDGETEASASGFAGAGFVDAVEAFEQAGEMLGGDAGAEVSDKEFHGVRNGAGAENDASSGWAVFQRIVDQVGKNLVDRFAVGEDGTQMLDRRIFVLRRIVNLPVLNMPVLNLPSWICRSIP